jgi:hypothetical protein
MTFYLDENFSEYIADALNSLNKGHYSDVTVKSTIHTFGRSAADQDIIPQIAKEDAFFITRDFGKNDPVIFPLCRQYKVYSFFIYMKPQLNKHWDIVKTIINNWEEMVDKGRNEKRHLLWKVRSKGKMEKL